MTTDVSSIGVGERNSSLSWIYDPRIVHHYSTVAYLYHIQEKKLLSIRNEMSGNY